MHVSKGRLSKRVLVLILLLPLSDSSKFIEAWPDKRHDSGTRWMR